MTADGLTSWRTFANPAAGAGWSVTIPSGEAWRLWGGGCTLTTSATVATRVPSVRATKSGITLFADYNILRASSTGPTASGTWTIVYSPKNALLPAVWVGSPTNPEPIGLPTVWLPPGTVITGNFESIAVGDQVSNLGLLIEVTNDIYPTSTAEILQFDGLDLNAGALSVQGIDCPPAPKRQEWAQGSDADGSTLIRDPLSDNREVTLRIRVRPQASMDAALAQIGLIVKKIEESEQQVDGLPLVWQPAGSTRRGTFYVVSGFVEDLPFVMSGEDAGWFLRSPAPVLTVRLQCKPFMYGPDVTYGPISSATPYVAMTLTNVPGDVPADARVLVTDAATQNRRFVEVGVEWRYFDAATSNLIESDNLVTSGCVGFQTTRTGAYDVGGGNNVVRGTLAATPTALCASGTLTHVGTYRVKARLYAVAAQGIALGAADPPSGLKVRLNWQEGDGPYSANPYVSPAVSNGFSEVDLGLITIPPKRLGTQRWQGRVEAYTTNVPGTDTIDVDYLVLVPAGEGYGKARAPYGPNPEAPLAASARDEFDQTAAALATKVLPVGGTWTGAGDADDFNVIAGSSHLARRATTSDTDFRFEQAGSTSYTDVGVQVDFLNTAPGTTIVTQGVFARYSATNTNIHAHAQIRSGANDWIVGVQYRNGGGDSDLIAPISIGALNMNTWYSIRLVALADGQVFLWFGQRGFLNLIAQGWSSLLATGGALASGTAGIVDQSTSASASTRDYDNFFAFVPTVPRVLYSGKAAEIRSDGALRQDASGVYYGSVPEYRGGPIRIPAAGDEARSTRVLVKAHRGDIEEMASDPVTDNLTVSVIVTPRYSVVPWA